MHLVEASKTEVAAIHDVDGPRLGTSSRDIDLVNLAVSDKDHGWDASAQIEKGMELHSTFAFAEFCPGEQRQAQIYCRRIESIGGLIQLYPERVVDIELSGLFDEHLCEVGRYAIRQSRT